MSVGTAPHAVLACDFFTTVTASFRVLYVFVVFVVLEVGTRRILHWNVTEHPTAEWTIQQFRAVITPETSHRFVLHDRDSIYAATVDRAIASMGGMCSKHRCGHRKRQEKTMLRPAAAPIDPQIDEAQYGTAKDLTSWRRRADTARHVRQRSGVLWRASRRDGQASGAPDDGPAVRAVRESLQGTAIR
jgi:hypothetical protein